MKLLMSIIFCSFFCDLHAQALSFEQTISFIQNKINCCSVPFTGSAPRRVDSISISKQGDITLSYSDDKPNQTFNVFQLYEEDVDSNGIDTIMGGKFIQFYINEERIRLIRFATAADASEVYSALLSLYPLLNAEEKMFSDLNFNQTLDVINIRLTKWSEDGDVKLNALQNGDVVIANIRNQTFRFNFFDLDNDHHGIETEVCDVRRHAPRAWINFQKGYNTKAFIRLKCSTPEAELKIMRGAFLHLKSLCSRK